MEAEQIYTSLRCDLLAARPWWRVYGSNARLTSEELFSYRRVLLRPIPTWIVLRRR